MRILVTGAAGFVGYHVSSRLLKENHEVTGHDNLNEYYDARLKHARLAQLRHSSRFSFAKGELEHLDDLRRVAERSQPEYILHLGAQAGVRYSLEAPEQYASSNLIGTFNVLEVAREFKPAHLMIASSSSVYGGNMTQPYAEHHRTDFPMSFYAATKKATEDLSHSYAHLHGIPTTCFRFFTVYGPWGRPDMALFKFAAKMERGESISVYGGGKMKRDFTYIDDLVEGIVRLLPVVPDQITRIEDAAVDSLSPVAPWRTVNISGGQPVGLEAFIETLETEMGVVAQRSYVEGPSGDVPETFADPALLVALTGYKPETPLAEGVRHFIRWYRNEWMDSVAR